MVSQIVRLLNSWNTTAEQVHNHVWKTNAVYKMVDTCAAEFESETPYFYSYGFGKMNSIKSRYAVLGSRSNRIGQGVEFDYATVHFLLRRFKLQATKLLS